MMVLTYGNRGLFCSDDNRIYFPDRSWRDADECFIKDYTIKNDKGTYAFIVGTPIITEPISVDEIPNLIVGKVYKQITLRKSTAVAYHDGTDIYLLIKENGKITEYRYSTRNRAVLDLYNRGTKLSIDVVSYVSKNFVLDTEEKLLEALFRGLSKNSGGDLSGVEVIDDVFLVFTKEYSYSEIKITYTYYYNFNTGELVFCDVDSDELRKKAKKIKKYSVSDIAKQMIKYGVTVNSLAYKVSFSSKLRRCNISKDSFNAVIYAFDADEFTFEYYNSEESRLERQIVEQSINLYNDLVKSFGKSLSSKNAVNFLSSINIRNYLLKTAI